MIKRKSNIELLRIISMLLIICFHYVYKSGYTYEHLTINTFIVKLVYHFGELGVNLFILISGYFLVRGKFSIKKLILLLIEVLFYQIFIYSICYFLGIYHFTSIRSLLFIVFPTILNQYWFITAYVLLYIMSPFLNIFINSMSKETHKKFLLIALFIWSIIPTVFGIIYNDTEVLVYYNRFIWFIIMYLTASYIRLYGIKLFKNKKNTWIVAILSLLLIVSSIFIIYFFRSKFKVLGLTEIAYFWGPNTIPIFLLSISIFYLFLNLNMKNYAIINLFASTTLGVYILHDNTFNKYMWTNVFKTKEHLNSSFSILYILGTALLIFICFSIVDLIRQFIEKRTVKKILDSNFFDKFINKMETVFHKICNYI